MHRRRNCASVPAQLPAHIPTTAAADEVIYDGGGAAFEIVEYAAGAASSSWHSGNGHHEEVIEDGGYDREDAEAAQFVVEAPFEQDHREATPGGGGGEGWQHSNKTVSDTTVMKQTSKKLSSGLMMAHYDEQSAVQ